MRRIILILLAIFAMAAAASAAQINVTVTSSDNWLTANGKDNAVITVTVIDTAGEHAGEPFEGANVTFSVNSPWHLRDTQLVTDKKGVASTTLLSTTVSGTANITVVTTALKLTELFGWVAYTDSQVYGQICDHTTPNAIVTSYKGQAQVRTAIPITVFTKDYYGNPVDNRGETVENVGFDASSQGVSGFASGGKWVKSLTVPVNESGYAVVQYFVDPLGINYIYIDPPSPIRQKLITIEGISTGTPYKVANQVSPGGSPYPYTTIKTGQFTIAYTFTDQNGYPTSNQSILINTSAGETMKLTTNKYGMVVLTYGPKDIAGIYTINATALSNQSVFASPKVEFVNGEAVDALLTASPQTMASRDVKEDIASILTMRVMDQKGNPVEGESVNFRFKSFTVSGMYNQTIAPVLENGAVSTTLPFIDIPAVSDENGEAMVTFHPGAFTIDTRVPNYNASAEGKAVVEAQWADVKRTMTLRYINYPYLTIESEVSPTTIRVNETVDLTVRVKGDGWALQSKPIDVMLVTDRSGSMLDDFPDREVSVMGAAKVFSSQLDYSRDRLGQVSFGGTGTPKPADSSACGDDDNKPVDDDNAYALANYASSSYSDTATIDQALTPNKALIDSKIASIVPGGYTPMRWAIFRAIYESRTKWNANSVKALIVLSDGDFNEYGDPLARGTGLEGKPSGWDDVDISSNKSYWKISTTNGAPITLAGSGATSLQNMSNYAKSYSIKVFTIAFANKLSADGKLTLQNLAAQTGGKYYDATAANIAAVYTDIAGALRDEAGVNTTMNLTFKNIVVGNVTLPGEQVYEYQYISGRSTRVTTWNQTANPLPGYPKIYNSTDQWKADRTINFNIGTIRLNQTWQSTVTLKVLQEGNINVFDSNSKITTENSLAPLKVPDLYITALPNSSEVTYASANLHIRNLTRTNEGSISTADLKWEIDYDGTSPITEGVMVAPYGTEDWSRMPLRQVPGTTKSDTASITISTLPVGDYTIRVTADAMDANTDIAEIHISISAAARRPQIKIGG
jgi:hypothetical protein